MPISSSGHIAIVPWLLGWRYAELDEEQRKSFEVALHAGAAAALLIALRREVLEAVRDLDRRRVLVAALSFAPAAVVGCALEGPVERRLGTPVTIAWALFGGAVAITLADTAPQLRDHDDAGPKDGLWLGIAQATALIPGVSRGGATLAAARARAFTREAAARLSRHAALPVIAGATALKLARMRSNGLRPELRAPFAAGAAASFCSTLASSRLIGVLERDGALLPYAAYRTALAGVIAWRMRRARTAAPRATVSDRTVSSGAHDQGQAGLV